MPDFAPLKNDLLLRAARREPVERVPVWMMRQAGRYLPEFREVRAEADFFRVCRTPELAAEVTLQPLRRFPLDAAIIFSDILVVPQAMGLDVVMVKGKGPHFPAPLDSPDDLDRVAGVGQPAPDVRAELGYVYDALALTRRLLDGRVPLIGFAGAPWTLAAYAIEGGGSKQFARCKTWVYAHPEALHALLDATTEVVIEHLMAQAEAGAQVLQVFDSWAGELTPLDFETFSRPYLLRIADALKQRHPEVPLIVFARNAHHALDALADSAYDVVGLDWGMLPEMGRAIVGERAAVQGNLDPAALFAPPAAIRRHVERMLQGFAVTGDLRGVIANLGHGMMPSHDPEHAGAFVRAVQELSASMIAQS